MGQKTTLRDRSWLKQDQSDKSYWVDIHRKGVGRLRKKIEDPVSPRDHVTKMRAIEIGDAMVSAWLAGHEKKPRMTFEEAAEQMLVVDRARLRASTMKTMQIMIRNNLMPSFGRLFLDEIRDTHWAAHVVARRKVKPDCAFFQDAKYFNKVINWAKRNDVRTTNVRATEGEKPAVKAKVIPRADYERMLAAAGPDLRLILMMGWECGMRKSEILKLEWDRVDLKGGIIHLHPHHTKTKKGRSFPLPENILLNLRERPKVSRWVFPHAKDHSRPKIAMEKTWERMLARAGLTRKGFHFHCTRHSFLTRKLVHEGQSLVLVCRFAGLSPRVATSVYLHTKTEDLRSIVNGVSTA